MLKLNPRLKVYLKAIAYTALDWGSVIFGIAAAILLILAFGWFLFNHPLLLMIIAFVVFFAISVLDKVRWL